MSAKPAAGQRRSLGFEKDWPCGEQYPGQRLAAGMGRVGEILNASAKANRAPLDLRFGNPPSYSL